MTDMNRRGFISLLVGGVAAAAAVRTFPFRVFSFPTEIVTPVACEPIFYARESMPMLDAITATTLRELREDILVDRFFVDSSWLSKLRQAREFGGSIRLPVINL